jgi:hypothetical protein
MSGTVTDFDWRIGVKLDDSARRYAACAEDLQLAEVVA